MIWRNTLQNFGTDSIPNVALCTVNSARNGKSFRVQKFKQVSGNIHMTCYVTRSTICVVVVSKLSLPRQLHSYYHPA